MASLIQCCGLLRYCFGINPESNENEDISTSANTFSMRRMFTRLRQENPDVITVPISYSTQETHDSGAGDILRVSHNAEDECRRIEDEDTVSSDVDEPPPFDRQYTAGPLFSFFGRFRTKGSYRHGPPDASTNNPQDEISSTRNSSSVVQPHLIPSSEEESERIRTTDTTCRHDAANSIEDASLPNDDARNGGHFSTQEPDCVYEALSYDCNPYIGIELPSVPQQSFIMPGSDEQKKMALAMSSRQKKETEDEDECVICLETFCRDNPRMPTLCGCGENKTYFHLPCLFQWIERDQNCPSCRQRLRWEEF